MIEKSSIRGDLEELTKCINSVIVDSPNISDILERSESKYGDMKKVNAESIKNLSMVGLVRTSNKVLKLKDGKPGDKKIGMVTIAKATLLGVRVINNRK